MPNVPSLFYKYDEETVRIQLEFMREIGPYYNTVKREDFKAFFARVKNYWFSRWKLEFSSADAMAKCQELVMLEVEYMIIWASFRYSTEEEHYKKGWEGFLSYCEAKEGIKLSDEQRGEFAPQDRYIAIKPRSDLNAEDSV